MSILSILRRGEKRRLTINVRKVEIGMDLVIHPQCVKKVATIYLQDEKVCFRHDDGSVTSVLDRAHVIIEVEPGYQGLGAEDNHRIILENKNEA